MVWRDCIIMEVSMPVEIATRKIRQDGNEQGILVCSY